MSAQDIQTSDVKFTNVVESVGAYAVVYVDLSVSGRFPIGYGQMNDDINRPFWDIHRSDRDDAIFADSVRVKDPVMEHFTPNDGEVYKIPWKTDTVLAVILWDDQNDTYMPVKMGDGVTVDLDDDFGASHNHKAIVEQLQGHEGDKPTKVKVKSVEGDSSTWIDADQIRSVYKDGPSWSRKEDSSELAPQ